jgi:hypothetical protein
MMTDAYLSPDRMFRYWLLRQWNPALQLLALIGSNPSTADENKDDPTIRKEVGFAARLGFGGIIKLNVGAYRATNPKDWKAAADPFGPANTIDHLQGYLIRFAPGKVIAAWGKPCMSSPRGVRRAEEITRAIVGMECWGRNGDGSPKHPLMLPYSTQLEPFGLILSESGGAR